MPKRKIFRGKRFKKTSIKKSKKRKKLETTKEKSASLDKRNEDLNTSYKAKVVESVPSSASESLCENQSSYNLLLKSFNVDSSVAESDVESSSDDDEDDDLNTSENEGSGSSSDSNAESLEEESKEEDESGEESSNYGDEEDNSEDIDRKLNEDKSKTKLKVIPSDTENIDYKLDPFRLHFDEVLADDDVPQLTAQWISKEIKFKTLGSCKLLWMLEKLLPSEDYTLTNNLKFIKSQLLDELQSTNQIHSKTCLKKSERLTSFQSDILGVFHKYQDLYYPLRNHDNGEEIRVVYCLHVLNHLLKSRHRIVTNSLKKKANKHDVTFECRDQGLTRPKVLILVPFKDSALRVVNIIMDLMSSGGDSYVSNKKRLQKEFGNEEPENMERKSTKPDDYSKIFAGNTDDFFRLGMSVAKKTLKIYTKFYTSDIIIASPLGLRTAAENDGDSENYDFLSSIEILILDQADIFLMQNWEHVSHIFQHLHLQPRESHGVDFSRVRMWNLNGWSKFYRQTLVFSSVPSPLIKSLFTKYCFNYSGKVLVNPPSSNGSICEVVVALPQVFHRFVCGSYTTMNDDRFNFFCNKILPHSSDPVMSRCLVFVPSYYDYVRVRNYFSKNELNFNQICEYTKLKNISKARNEFFSGKSHFILYTERAHFYHRFNIRGARHIIFYSLPTYPHFYPELCNMLQANVASDSLTCTVICCRYDLEVLAAVVGTQRAAHIAGSEKNVHMFVSGEN